MKLITLTLLVALAHRALAVWPTPKHITATGAPLALAKDFAFTVPRATSALLDAKWVIAFNDGFLELLGLPLNQFRWGVPLASLIRHRAATGEYGEG